MPDELKVPTLAVQVRGSAEFLKVPQLSVQVRLGFAPEGPPVQTGTGNYVSATHWSTFKGGP